VGLACCVGGLLAWRKYTLGRGGSSEPTSAHVLRVHAKHGAPSGPLGAWATSRPVPVFAGVPAPANKPALARAASITRRNSLRGLIGGRQAEGGELFAPGEVRGTAWLRGGGAWGAVFLFLDESCPAMVCLCRPGFRVAPHAAGLCSLSLSSLLLAFQDEPAISVNPTAGLAAAAGSMRRLDIAGAGSSSRRLATGASNRTLDIQAASGSGALVKRTSLRKLTTGRSNPNLFADGDSVGVNPVIAALAARPVAEGEFSSGLNPMLAPRGGATTAVASATAASGSQLQLGQFQAYNLGAAGGLMPSGGRGGGRSGSPVNLPVSRAGPARATQVEDSKHTPGAAAAEWAEAPALAGRGSSVSASASHSSRTLLRDSSGRHLAASAQPPPVPTAGDAGFAMSVNPMSAPGWRGGGGAAAATTAGAQQSAGSVSRGGAKGTSGPFAWPAPSGVGSVGGGGGGGGGSSRTLLRDSSLRGLQAPVAAAAAAAEVFPDPAAAAVLVNPVAAMVSRGPAKRLATAAVAAVATARVGSLDPGAEGAFVSVNPMLATRGGSSAATPGQASAPASSSTALGAGGGSVVASQYSTYSRGAGAALAPGAGRSRR
jgi:hypothetical protein